MRRAVQCNALGCFLGVLRISLLFLRPPPREGRSAPAAPPGRPSISSLPTPSALGEISSERRGSTDSHGRDSAGTGSSKKEKKKHHKDKEKDKSKKKVTVAVCCVCVCVFLLFVLFPLFLFFSCLLMHQGHMLLFDVFLWGGASQQPVIMQPLQQQQKQKGQQCCAVCFGPDGKAFLLWLLCTILYEACHS